MWAHSKAARSAETRSTDVGREAAQLEKYIMYRPMHIDGSIMSGALRAAARKRAAVQ